MDHDLLMSRMKMQDTIIQHLLRKQSDPSGEWLRRLMEIARRLEERIFKNAASKEDYMSTTEAEIDQQLQAMSRPVHSNNHPQ